MKIKIAGIELGEWEKDTVSGQPWWYRCKSGTGKDQFGDTFVDTVDIIMVGVRETIDSTIYYATFYYELFWLHEHFPYLCDGDLETAKRHMDDFLLRMSRLTAFV
jgi:hypothetical protein